LGVTTWDAPELMALCVNRQAGSTGGRTSLGRCGNRLKLPPG